MGKSYYGVLGSPINHSKSPEIHSRFASELNISLQYDRIEVGKNELATFLTEKSSKKYSGFNVTVPLKEEAYQCCKNPSIRALSAKAANTLIRQENHWLADNTDGVGLVRDFNKNLKVSIEKKNVLIIGAGGAARGVIKPLLDEKPATVTIMNRTLQNARKLADDNDKRVRIIPWGDELVASVDLVINSTSLSLHNKLPPLDHISLRPELICYDMVYSNKDTIFIEWARRKKAKVIADGLGMLVEQAAESFKIWHKVMPRTDIVLSALRKNLPLF